MYYVGKNGSQSGPYPLDELKTMAAGGQLAPSDLVWTDGMSEWKPASAALPEVFAGIPVGTPAPPPVMATSFPTAAAAAPTVAAPPPYAAGEPVAASLPFGTPIPTYLWQSIVVTLFCCLPCGIPAIVYASQVDSKRQNGDIAGALNSSKNAKLWCWIGLVIGILQMLGIIVYIVFVVIAAASQAHH